MGNESNFEYPMNFNESCRGIAGGIIEVVAWFETKSTQIKK